MTLLDNMGERPMYGYLSELTNHSDTEIWYDCPSESTSDTEVWYDCLSEFSSFDNDTENCIKLSSVDFPLKNDDIHWIFEIIKERRHRWESLAIALKLTMAEIEDCRKSDNMINLYNILCCWLAKCTSNHLGVSNVVAALSSINENMIAKRLTEKCTLNKKMDSKVKSESYSSSLSLQNQSCEVEVIDGKSTLLHVQAGLKESAYQWGKNGQPLANSCTYYGVNEDILVVSHASQGTEGEYTCSVSCGGSEECSNKITLTVLYPPAKKRLLDLYSVHREVPPDSWPPVGTKSFVNLTLVRPRNNSSVNEDADKVVEPRVKADYNDVFGNFLSRTLIVTRGRPGSGKTTLVSKIVKDWSRGIAIRRAKLVFHITLRVLSRNTALMETLPGILKCFYHNEEDLRKVCEEIEAGNGEDVCFVIDGLDEYHPQDRDNSLIYQLLDKTFLPLAMIIVTSRPVAVGCIKKEAITHKVEVGGFDKDQILEYIDNFPFDSSSFDSAAIPAKLKDYLNSHPNVFNMCYLPVHASIICFLFNHQKGNIPSTQTEIYQEFIRSTILRHLRRQNLEAQVRSLKKLRGNTKNHFNKLSQLAYSMTINKKQVATPEIMDDELNEYVSSNSDEWCLGLVTSNRISELFGFTKTYSFLHLTIQEFLTAYYITNLEQDAQMEVLSTFGKASSPVAIFYFGLAQFQSGMELKLWRTLHLESYTTFLCHCALESKQQIVCDTIGDVRKGIFRIFYPTPSDLCAMSYTIQNTYHSVREISLNAGNTECDCTEFLQSISSRNFCGLQKLGLYNKLNDKAVLALASFLRSCSSVREASMAFHEIGQDSAQAIADNLNHLVNIQDLRVYCYSTSGGVTTLLSGLTQFTNTKLYLFFYRLSFGVLEIGRGLQLLSNGGLYRLEIRKCNIDNESVPALANGLRSVTLLESLDLRWNSICQGGAVTLLNEVHCLTRLKELYLCHNNIGCEGAVALADQLHCVTQLKWMYLSHNTIGPHGAVSLANTIHHLTELEKLDLSCNTIDLSSAMSVITASKQCQNLSDIKLNTDTDDHYGSGVHVEGLVSPGDDTVIVNLMAATQHPTLQRDLHLGFKSVFLKSRMSQ